MVNFDLEKLADEYCAEHGIDLYDPVRGQVLTAFCIGAKTEREACAKIAEDFNAFPHALSVVGERIATKIRMRSNVELRGASRLHGEASLSNDVLCGVGGKADGGESV